MQRNDLRFIAKRPDTLESKLHLWLDSRFLVMGLSGFRIPIIGVIPGVLGWIMDSNARDSGFHKEFPGFRVPQAKISKIQKSVLNYMGRNDKRRANYNATRNRSFRYKSFRYKLKQWNYTKISLTSSNVCAPTRETFWVNILRTSSTVTRKQEKHAEWLLFFFWAKGMKLFTPRLN